MDIGSPCLTATLPLQALFSFGGFFAAAFFLVPGDSAFLASFGRPAFLLLRAARSAPSEDASIAWNRIASRHGKKMSNFIVA